MKKTHMILAAIGGTSVLAALVLGYFIFDAVGVKSENEERIASGLASAKGVMKKLPVKAEPAELKVFGTNAAAYDEWRAEAEKLAARGDLVFEATTPALFKTALVADARRIAALPGCFDGAFARGDFGFGFRDYVTGGAMPPEAELKRLQREWNDVALVLKTLAESGGTGIGVTELTMGKAKSAEPEEEAQPKSRKERAKARAKKNAQAQAKAKGKAKGTDEAEAGPAITAFTVDFVARPSALVKALNALMTQPRFVVVENCTFVRENDALKAALDGDARTERKARKGGSAEAEDAEALVVTDPATAPMLKVRMAVSVYDFGTLEKTQAEDAAKEGGTK